MKIQKLKVNLASVMIIALLVFSNLFVFSVSAVDSKFLKESEGYYFDDFVDMDGLKTPLKDCEQFSDNNGHINLSEGIPNYFYDYDEDPDSIEMWEQKGIYVGEGSFEGILATLTPPDLIPGDEIKSKKYLAAIGDLDDDSYFQTRSEVKLNNKVNYPMHHFRVTFDQDEEIIKSAVVKWWFGDYVSTSSIPNINSVRMYLWTYDDIIQKWEEVASVDYNKENIGREFGGEKLPDLVSPTFSGEDPYISGDGFIDVLIMGAPIQNEHNAYIHTGYFSVTLESEEGYLNSGSITSKVIEPTNLGGWENVFWDSSKYGTRTGITIKVLDEDEEEIEGYSSTTSPLDISGITNTKIRLKAEFHSESYKNTPYLYSWGVVYQKETEAYDSFTNEYRIDETIGTELIDGDVVISDYYSEWPFFGKNSENTRYYLGDPISEPKGVYWYSEENLVGGGFRGPITSEGKIYVPSVDKRIYVYNLTKNPDDTVKDYEKRSAANYEVDSCLAAYEDYIFVATGKVGDKNKIYCLYKSNLTEKWSYPSGNEVICFSAPATIDNGRLYISSWGGNFWDTAYLSFISAVMGALIGSNNQLIALDADTGALLWEDPAILPAASISTPAVGKGNVYVGCQNMYDSEKFGSLYAFDDETGEEVWNTSIGIIGRGSPTYAEGKVFVLSNEKKNISAPGEYMLTAVNAVNGKTEWNMSFGGFKTTSSFNLLKGWSFFYKLIEGFAPASTPAYADDTLFVLTPNGTLLALDVDGNEKWSYDLKSDLIDISYYITSPTVVGERVYAISGDARLFSFKTKQSTSDIKPEWEYKVEGPVVYEYNITDSPDVIASPIIADGVILLSGTDNTSSMTGRLYCIGDYSVNTQGYVKSATIHVPPGKWWNRFNAVYTNDTENTVVFKILDENNEVLIDEFKKFNKTTGLDISNANSNGIKLYAELTSVNDTQTPAVLKSWTVNWSDESRGPIFRNNTFEAGGGTSGWVNADIDQCTIEVYDREYNDIKSGLDLSTAKYRIGYIEKNSNDHKLSGWIQANSTDESSGVAETTLIADLEGHSLSVKSYINITFTIKDLAGNTAYSAKFNFKTDTKKPDSEILNRDDFEDSYNNLVEITASATDSGTGDDVSGIQYVSLMYRQRNTTDDNWGEWNKYGADLTPDIYNWEFGTNMKSGYYQLITIAVDKAGNKQDISTSKAVDFFLDNTPPSIDTVFDDEYSFRELPTFSLEVSDDYSLEDLYYRFDNTTEWTKISTDIQGEKTAEVEWTMPESKWASFKEGEEHDLFFKLTDSNDNIYEVTKPDNPKVAKDQNISQYYLDLSDLSAWQWDDTYTIKLNTPEDMEVKKAQLFYQYSEDEKVWTEEMQIGGDITEAPFEFDFKAENGSGYYRFYVKVYDASGPVIISDSQTESVTLAPVPALAIYIALSVIFILVTLFIIMKMKKKD